MPEHLRRKAQSKLPEPAVSEGHVAGNDTAAKAVLGWTRSRYDGYHKPGWTVGSAVGSQHVFEVPNKTRAKKNFLSYQQYFCREAVRPGLKKRFSNAKFPLDQPVLYITRVLHAKQALDTPELFNVGICIQYR